MHEQSPGGNLLRQVNELRRQHVADRVTEEPGAKPEQTEEEPIVDRGFGRVIFQEPGFCPLTIGVVAVLDCESPPSSMAKLYAYAIDATTRVP